MVSWLEYFSTLKMEVKCLLNFKKVLGVIPQMIGALHSHLWLNFRSNYEWNYLLLKRMKCG
jgi:hypothetical protein